MEDKKWRQVKDLFLEALDKDGDDRLGFLRQLASRDVSLKDEVQSLIDAHDEADSFIEEPQVTDQSALLETITGRWALGRRIGEYRIVRQLGPGSLGATFVGKSPDEEVAIELVSPEVKIPEVEKALVSLRARIETLDHPGLAQLRETGTTPEGIPFLISEFIRGRRLNRQANRDSFPLAKRLDLFKELTGVVAYIHSEGLVHRDIKPRNILLDDQGAVRLLDVGLPSLFDPGVLQKLEESGDPALTTPYSSPEQLQGLPPTAVSDLWALGLYLFELLTGSRPWKDDPDHLKRAILTEKPARPLETLGALAPEALATVAAQRATTPAGLEEALRPFEAFFVKALAKTPEARFGNTVDLLENLPSLG